MNQRKIFLYAIDLKLIHTDWIIEHLFPQIIIWNNRTYKYHTDSRYIETTHHNLIPFRDQRQEEMFQEVHNEMVPK